VCSRTNTCSDGVKGTGEDGVDCGGKACADSPCVFVTESFCGTEFNFDNPEVTLTAYGGGFTFYDDLRFRILVDADNGTSSTTDCENNLDGDDDTTLRCLDESDFDVTVTSDSELHVAFLSFHSSHLGTVWIQPVRNIVGGTRVSVAVVADATAIATVFTRAPVVNATPGNSITSAAERFTISGSGFDATNCRGHNVVLLPPDDCGTAAAIAGATCTASTLEVIVTELSSRNAGNLSAMVRACVRACVHACVRACAVCALVAW
jgi:hypothetical protein